MPAAQPAMAPRMPWCTMWPATAPAAPYLRQPPGAASATGAVNAKPAASVAAAVRVSIDFFMGKPLGAVGDAAFETRSLGLGSARRRAHDDRAFVT